MDRDIIGAQLYTLRDFLKTPEDVGKTFKKLREIGFTTVQVSGMGNTDITSAELKKMLDNEGLNCVATHESGTSIIENTEAVIERLKILDCKYTAYPHPHKPIISEKDALELAKALNTAGAKMRKEGLQLLYHNHADEFMRFNGKTILDIIYDETNPENLAGEIDTYWVQYGGENPVKWCQKLKNRLPVIHLKDYGIVDKKITIFEVGYGNLDMPEIIRESKKSGTEYFLIEQDVCPVDPFESLKMSLEYLLEI